MTVIVAGDEVSEALVQVAHNNVLHQQPLLDKHPRPAPPICRVASTTPTPTPTPSTTPSSQLVQSRRLQ